LVSLQETSAQCEYKPTNFTTRLTITNDAQQRPLIIDEVGQPLINQSIISVLIINYTQRTKENNKKSSQNTQEKKNSHATNLQLCRLARSRSLARSFLLHPNIIMLVHNCDRSIILQHARDEADVQKTKKNKLLLILLIVKAVLVVLLLLLYEPVWMNLNCLAWSWLRPSVVIYRFLPVAGHT